MAVAVPEVSHNAARAAVEAYWAAWNATRAEREERHRRALERSGKVLRAALAPVLEAVQKDPPQALAEALKPWGRGRALALPWEIGGGYASEPAVFCRRCRTVLSLAWGCRCAEPDPAVLVPIEVLMDLDKKGTRRALEAARKAMEDGREAAGWSVAEETAACRACRSRLDRCRCVVPDPVVVVPAALVPPKEREARVNTYTRAPEMRLEKSA
jgi:hypothetical protein